MALTKAELADNIISVLGIHKMEARHFIDLFFDEIRNALAAGEEVKLSGFGKFRVRNKNSRPGRNPKTGELVEVSARRVVTFHPGQKLKELIQDIQAENNYSVEH